MKTITIAELKANFEYYLKEGTVEPIAIVENGQTVAALNLIVDPDELERLMLARNPKFNRLMSEADQRLEETGGIKHDDFWKLVEERKDS